MTKLMEWIFAAILFGTFYVSALMGLLPLNISNNQKFFIMISPIVLVALFGVYTFAVLVYRVATFNDCIEAAEELRQEINDAKRDLRSKGIKIE